jgi:tripeptidyl-peptidase-1
VTAGLIGLINDARLRAGKPAVGFVNPWLYSTGTAAKTLIDVTGGGSQGCNGYNLQTGSPIDGSIIPWASWNSTVGWDPVTGLGMPNLEKLVADALTLT